LQSYQITIYFDKLGEIKTLEYLSEPNTEPPFKHVLKTYCMHLARTLIKTQHSDSGKALAINLRSPDPMGLGLDCTLDYMKSDGIGYKTIPFDGQRKKKRIIINSKFNDDTVLSFSMKMKRYGFWGFELENATTRSALLHLYYLLKLYGFSSTKGLMLLAASPVISSYFLEGKLTKINHQQVAIEIANNILINQ
jgi:hypothetical protein